MAKIELNPSLGSVRGKIDGWVYRSLHGQTVVTPQGRTKKGRPSRAQADRRERFRAAQAYAAAVLADPLKRLVYQKLGADRKRPPNTLLVSNFLTPPTIHAIDPGGYAGGSGHLIQVLASDAIEVTRVTVRIRDVASGTELEAGPAAPDHGIWHYRTTVIAPAGARLQIEVAVRNRADAEATDILSRF